MGNRPASYKNERFIYFNHDMIKQNKDKFKLKNPQENLDYLDEEFKPQHLFADFVIINKYNCKSFKFVVESPQITVCPSKQQYGFFTKWLDTDYYTLCPNPESKMFYADLITELSWKAGQINVIPVFCKHEDNKYSYKEYPECVPKEDINGRINFCSRENPIFNFLAFNEPLLFRFEGEGEIQLKLGIICAASRKFLSDKTKRIETKITDRHWLCISCYSASVKIEPENRCLICYKFCGDKTTCCDIDLIPNEIQTDYSKMRFLIYDY